MRLDAVFQLARQAIGLAGRDGGGEIDTQLGDHFELVEVAVARDHQLVLRRQLRHLQNQLFDLGGEDVHAADDQHVVRAARDLADAAHRARGGRQQAGQVARAVADDGQRLLRQRGEDQFTLLAIRQHFARFRIDDLGVEMIFPDDGSVLAFDAFRRHARPHYFGQAIDVDGVDAGARFDFRTHGVRPRLGAEDAHLQRRFSRIETLAREFLDDVEHVRRRDHDDRWLEILDQLHLLFRLAARHRDDGAAQAFGTVMRAQAAREQAVAVGDMHHVARAAAAGTDRARHHVGPGIDVVLRVANHRCLARGAARRVDAHHLLARHGKQTERIIVAQDFFIGEREFRQIGQRLQVVRMHARFVKSGAVMGHVVIRVLERPFHAFELQRLQFILAGALDRFEVIGGRRTLDHHCLLFNSLTIQSVLAVQACSYHFNC